MTGRHGVRSPLWRAARLALVYAVSASLWIGLSDALLGLWLSDPEALTWVQTAKGVAFVTVTALVLFAVSLRQHIADATLLRRLEAQRAELRHLSQFRQNVIDNASVWINVLDPEARVTVWNKAAEQISGYRREEVLGNADIWTFLYPDADYREAITRKAAEVLAGGTELTEFETTIRCRDGTEKVIAWHSRRFFDDAGNMAGSIALGRDITEQKRAREALVARERQLAVLMSNIPGMAYRCLNDSAWTMRFVSDGCRELCGYPPEALVDNAVTEYAALIPPGDRNRVEAEVRAAAAEGRQFAVEYRLQHRDGGLIWVWERGQAVTVDGETVLEGIVMDISERKAMEQELARLAARDPLTGLHNRRDLELRFASEIERARRHERSLALLWVDVDRFKAVNDRHGHRAGDRVLQALARLLQEHVRNEDYVARYGGEELAIVLPERDLQGGLEAAERLRELVAGTPFELPDGDSAPVTVSIGVAAFPEHGDSLEALCDAADTAMYRAKAAGRNRVRGAPEGGARRSGTSSGPVDAS